MEPVIQNNIKGVIYCTTNIVNGKKYIGKDSNNNPDYLGSGTIFKRSLKKFGKENFKKQILQDCVSLEDLNESEKYWIDYFGAQKSDLFYNITSGGIFGDTFTFHPDKEKLRERLSKSQKGRTPWNKGKTGIYSEETRNKISNYHKGKKLSNLHREKISEGVKNSEKHKKGISTKKYKDNLIKRLSKPRSEETKEKLRKVNLGKKVSEETKSKMRESRVDYRHSEETKKKIGLANKNRSKQKIKCLYCNIITNRININRWHNENCKFKNN